MTNNHVVEGCRELKIVRDGKPVTARVIATDAGADLAILRLPEPTDAVAAFHAPEAVKPGESVVVVGYPLRGLLGSDASVTAGIISSLAGVHNDKKELQITAPVQPGNSGGPLLDSAGAVVGIVVGKLNALKIAQATGALSENINFAVNAELARALLDKNSIKYDTVTAAEALPMPTIAERALKYTVLVQCYR
jgi:S1-C subfamily serine protease